MGRDESGEESSGRSIRVMGAADEPTETKRSTPMIWVPTRPGVRATGIPTPGRAGENAKKGGESREKQK